MLSRVADSIYWMNRYVERAENVARLIDVNLQLVLDGPPDQEQQWQPLVNATGDQEEFAELHGLATQDNVLQFLTSKSQFDPLLFAGGARECARRARSHFVGNVAAIE